MYPHNGFNIDQLFPTGSADVWCAEVSFTSDNEMIGPVEVAHNMRIKVRFPFSDDRPAGELLDTAHEKVRAVLAAFNDTVQSTSISDLQQKARDRDLASETF